MTFFCALHHEIKPLNETPERKIDRERKAEAAAGVWKEIFLNSAQMGL